jgi:signal transduction histidine kinase
MSNPGNGAESQELSLATLAVPVAPIAPDLPCCEVYEIFAADDSIFAVPIVESGRVVGLTDRITLISQFARPFWREIYSQRPIAKLMDPAPIVGDAAEPLEAIAQRIATTKPTALRGFAVTRSGAYLGVASGIDLLHKIADHAQRRALALSRADAEIRVLNVDLEHRVKLRTAELRTVQEEIMRKERLAVLGQLTATVAHELRNPLSAIRNTLFTIKEAVGADASDLERPFGRMERSILRCDRIINDLLEYTRAQDLRCRCVIADSWIAETIAEQSIPGDIVVATDLRAAGCRVSFDAERMRRVIVNLIDNAVQAMSESAAPRRITVTSGVEASLYRLTIADTGAGIAPDVLPRIFEPLFSTKPFGTGLGLPTVKQIVEQHGGEIAIGSELGEGTGVVVRLPGVLSEETARTDEQAA